MDDGRMMERALGLAEAAVAAGQAPFGALVADAAGRVLGEGHNRVRADRDPSAHGEVVAIRDALRREGPRPSGGLPPGCTLYTSCEPCLMCAAVIAGTPIRRVVFAARGTDVPGARRLLGADLTEAAAWAAGRPGWEPFELRGDLMRDRALGIMALFDWGRPPRG